MGSIHLKKVSKVFGEMKVIPSIDLEIDNGEFVVFVGPSGCGKSTLLRMIGGLDYADEGTLLIEGQDATLSEPHARRVGFVFQHYALFRHMSVFENVAFGLRVSRRKPKVSEEDIRSRVTNLLELVQLDWLAGRYPPQLSGGQRQRIALARALAVEPKVLLLDEPFGALDAKVRKDLRRWLREFHDRTGHTTFFVTHDQEEALELADRVVVMSQGKVEQVGTADDVYDRPNSSFVFSFIGESSHLPITVQNGHVVFEGVQVAVAAGEADGPGQLYFRPQDIVLSDGPQSIQGTVTAQRRLAGTRIAELDTSGDGPAHHIEIELPLSAEVLIGSKVRFSPTKWRIFR